MRKNKGRSLKWSLLIIIAICWLVPFSVILLYARDSLSNTVREKMESTITNSVENAVSHTKEQLESAMDASRASTYDDTIKTAYAKYAANNDEVMLYDTVNQYLLQQYGYNNLFNATFLFFTRHPETIYYESNRLDAGEIVNLQDYKDQAHEQITTLHEALGTGIGFYRFGDALYMVRNIVDSSFQPFAVIVMECNEDTIFEGIDTIVWLQAAQIEIDQNVTVQYTGENGMVKRITGGVSGAEPYDRTQTVKASGHTVRFSIATDNSALENDMVGVGKTYFLMGILMIPMLVFALWAYYHFVSRPMDALLEATEHMEAGERGYTVAKMPASREFYDLTDRFNSMSKQIESQFNHIYQEQIALQDARVQALRSQINPHFLNNTLEAVAWEARMGNSDKVARMIEALSVMLDAATARGGLARGTMRQELVYVDAYLYILSERLGDRLTVTKEMDDQIMRALVPCLILQPLVENAYEHGIAQRQHGEIKLRGWMEGSDLVIEVENTGTLTDKDRARIREALTWNGDSLQENNTQSYIGIRNVYRRLKILCGQRGSLEIFETRHDTVIARILLPDIAFAVLDTDGKMSQR